MTSGPCPSPACVVLPRVLVTLGISVGVATGQTPLGPEPSTSAPPPLEATPAVVATLTVGGRSARVKLVGVAANRIAYTDPDRAGVGQKILPKEAVEEAVFELEIPWPEIDEAMAGRDWMKAANRLLPALQPVLPYLDLPNNNAVDAVVTAGDCLLRAAEAARRSAATPEAEETARKRYEAAYAVYRKAAQAHWSSKGTVAQVKTIKCLLELQRPRTARRQFEEIDEPFPGDAAYGIYGLVKAELEAARGDFRAAMAAVVKSVAFENKDIDTFPDALMLSARCYEELQDWHRARDVYYEVARLFPRTDWADAAAQRLEFILDKGYTREPEKLPIENVFFKLQDDVNKLAAQYLEAKRKGTEVEDYATYAREEGGPSETPEEPEAAPLGGGSEPAAAPPTPANPEASPSPPSRPIRVPEVIQTPGRR